LDGPDLSIAGRDPREVGFGHPSIVSPDADLGKWHD
jgi:hypothetical protein